jgi:SAM-dependent methyltransferase
MASGNPKTREHYDHAGWKRDPDSGQLVDINAFGVREDGPIRKEMWGRFLERIQTKLRSIGSPLNILECGCGGNPAIHLLRDGDQYTGVDFSSTGLVEAEKNLQSWGGTYHLQQADICRLPFENGQFDAVFSTHVLYHIDNPEGQAKALDEIARVLRPGGVAILHLANPYPLLFPIRLGIRLVAVVPGLRGAAERLRKKGPVPYRPMSIGWYKRRLRPYGTVEMITGGIPSTWFNRKLTEYRYPTKLLWKAINTLDTAAPGFAAACGNYFLVFFGRS